MSDPRNVAHDKKVIQEKKHQGEDVTPEDAPAVQPGKKAAAVKKPEGDDAADASGAAASGASATAAATPPAALEASLVVLAKLKDLDFHSRANLERLAELTMTVEDELKQGEMVAPLGDVYSAQNAFQTKLTALIDAYKAECDRMQAEG